MTLVGVSVASAQKAAPAASLDGRETAADFGAALRGVQTEADTTVPSEAGTAVRSAAASGSQPTARPSAQQSELEQSAAAIVAALLGVAGNDLATATVAVPAGSTAPVRPATGSAAAPSGAAETDHVDGSDAAVAAIVPVVAPPAAAPVGLPVAVSGVPPTLLPGEVAPSGGKAAIPGVPVVARSVTPVIVDPAVPGVITTAAAGPTAVPAPTSLPTAVAISPAHPVPSATSTASTVRGPVSASAETVPAVAAASAAAIVGSALAPVVASAPSAPIVTSARQRAQEAVTSPAPATGPTAALGPTVTPAPAVASASSAPPAAPAAPPGFAAQLAKPVFTLAAAPAGEHIVTVKVVPEGLGPVTVRAHIGGDGTRIELYAPSDAGRDAIRSILPELRRDIVSQGLGASLGLSSQNQPSDGGDGGAHRDRTGLLPDRPAPTAPDPETAAPRRSPTPSTSTLDVMV